MACFKIMSGLVILLIFSSLSESVKNRTRRLTTFPESSATGILVAIAIPLNLPHREVFCSYNFEANYEMPVQPYKIIPGPLKRLDIDGVDQTVDAAEEEGRRDKRYIGQKSSLFSRKKIYKMFENKLINEGFKGRSCLLRVICEIATHPVNLVNGVLGDIFHIIFTPSSSMKENINSEYYRSEQLGKNGSCEKYQSKCPQNVLQFITTIIE